MPTPLLVIAGVVVLVIVVLAFVRGGTGSRTLAVLALPAAAVLGSIADAQCEREVLFGSGCEQYTTAGHTLMATAFVVWPTMLLVSLGLAVFRPRRRTTGGRRAEPASSSGS